MGTRDRVLIEIVICGICAAIFFLLYITPTTSLRAKANSFTMADLRNASTAQEAYYIDEATYAKSIQKLIGTYGFNPSEGVTIHIISADKSHYKMEAFHSIGTAKYVVEGPEGKIERYERDSYPHFNYPPWRPSWYRLTFYPFF